MRPLYSIFLVSAIMLIGVFGVFFMMHAEGDSHAECPFETVQSSSCESITNPLDLITFHMESILRPAVMPLFLGTLALIALFALAMLVSADVDIFGPQLLPAHALAFAIPAGWAAKRKFRAWLIIHEKRDPSSMAAMGA